MNQKQEEEFDYSRYSGGIENSLKKVSVKNRLVTLKQLQLETAIPRDLIIEVLDREEVRFPDRVDEIVDEKEGKTWKK
ncbi:MAG: hypothetical protein ACOC88_03695 [Candidatus Bipolaricaulota bacterium]